jgi:hypothetical protein
VLIYLIQSPPNSSPSKSRLSRTTLITPPTSSPPKEDQMVPLQSRGLTLTKAGIWFHKKPNEEAQNEVVHNKVSNQYTGGINRSNQHKSQFRPITLNLSAWSHLGATWTQCWLVLCMMFLFLRSTSYFFFLSFSFLLTYCFRPLNIIWQGDGKVYSSLSNIILEHNGEPVFDSGNIDIE